MSAWRRRLLPAFGAFLLSLAVGARAVPADGEAGSARTLQATTSTGRHGAYYAPPNSGRQPRPVLVFLHGSGGKGSIAMLRLRVVADRERVVVIAPDSVSVAGTWLMDARAQGFTEDHRHVMACVREVLALPDLRIDPQQVLIAGFSVGGGAASFLATQEDAFTAFAVLHGHVTADRLGPRRVRGWLSTGDRDRSRSPAAMKTLADDLRLRGRFPEIEMRVFAGDHTLGEEELSALVSWWLRRPPSPPGGG